MILAEKVGGSQPFADYIEPAVIQHQSTQYALLGFYRPWQFIDGFHDYSPLVVVNAFGGSDEVVLGHQPIEVGAEAFAALTAHQVIGPRHVLEKAAPEFDVGAFLPTGVEDPFTLTGQTQYLGQIRLAGGAFLLVEDIVVEIDQGVVRAGGYFITGEFGRFRAWRRGMRRRDCLSGSDRIFRRSVNRRSCLHRIARQQ